MAAQDEVILRRDLAQKHKVTLRTIVNWESTGYLPPSRRFGPKLRGWLRSEIERFLAEEGPR